MIESLTNFISKYPEMDTVEITEPEEIQKKKKDTKASKRHLCLCMISVS